MHQIKRHKYGHLGVFPYSCPLVVYLRRSFRCFFQWHEISLENASQYFFHSLKTLCTSTSSLVPPNAFSRPLMRNHQNPQSILICSIPLLLVCSNSYTEHSSTCSETEQDSPPISAGIFSRPLGASHTQPLVSSRNYRGWTDGNERMVFRNELSTRFPKQKASIWGLISARSTAMARRSTMGT